MYHCAPVIAAMTKQRKRSWQQKVLGSIANTVSVSPSDLFTEGAFATVDEAKAEGKKMLSCGEVEEATIRNHSCVLGARSENRHPPLADCSSAQRRSRPRAPTITCRVTRYGRTWPSGSRASSL